MDSRGPRNRFGAAVAASTLMATIVFGADGAGAGTPATYVGAATVVAKQAGVSPLVDAGAVFCRKANGAGIGGACVKFGGGDSIYVKDKVQGQNVAFQVCIDNNGDGLCGRGTTPTPCEDVIAFSHDDLGVFHNPLGPLPTKFTSGCPGGPFKGYIVFLCEGVHTPKTGSPPAHVHPATTGTAKTSYGGEGFGTFCGGGPPKPYRVR